MQLVFQAAFVMNITTYLLLSSKLLKLQDQANDLNNFEREITTAWKCGNNFSLKTVA